jgi:hypothetical protein
MHSPTSFTEHNTIEIDGYRMKNKWKELYNSTRQEMESRTKKFESSIGLFCYILKDMKRIIHDTRLPA